MITLNLTPDQIGRVSIALSAAQLAAIHAQEDAPLATPPSTGSSAAFASPPLIAGRSAMATLLPWTNGARVMSPGKLTDGDYWALHFVPASGTTLRFAGAENGGGTIHRNWIVYRADTGEVLGKCPQPSTQTTVQVQCAIGRPADPRHWEIRIEVGIEYVLAIVNHDVGKASAMFMDLFIS